MQDELALVREQLAQVREHLRPLHKELHEEATKQAQGAQNGRLLDALEAQIRPLAAEERMLLEEEHAMRLKARATGEQSFQAVEDALFDAEEGSNEHKTLTARYERLKEEKQTLLTQGSEPLGTHVGAADHLLRMECTEEQACEERVLSLSADALGAKCGCLEVRVPNQCRPSFLQCFWSAQTSKCRTARCRQGHYDRDVLSNTWCRQHGHPATCLTALMAPVAVAEVHPPDRDFDITNAMFARFEESTFPYSLNNIQALQQLLNMPLAARCPMHPSQWPRFQSLADSIFQEDATRTAPELQSKLSSAMLTHFPLSSASELNLTGFWDSVGFGLPELVGTVLGFAVIKQRWVYSAALGHCYRTVALVNCLFR